MTQIDASLVITKQDFQFTGISWMLMCGFGQKYKEFSRELWVLGVFLLLETLCLPFRICPLDHHCACSKTNTWSIPAGPSWDGSSLTVGSSGFYRALPQKVVKWQSIWDISTAIFGSSFSGLKCCTVLSKPNSEASIKILYLHAGSQQAKCGKERC